MESMFIETQVIMAVDSIFVHVLAIIAKTVKKEVRIWEVDKSHLGLSLLLRLALVAWISAHEQIRLCSF